jgi:hypothetical protein
MRIGTTASDFSRSATTIFGLLGLTLFAAGCSDYNLESNKDKNGTDAEDTGAGPRGALRRLERLDL